MFYNTVISENTLLLETTSDDFVDYLSYVENIVNYSEVLAYIISVTP